MSIPDPIQFKSGRKPKDGPRVEQIKRRKPKEPKYTIGDRFECLTIIDIATYTDKEQAIRKIYLCQCSCGRDTKVMAKNWGIVRSCGHLAKKNREDHLKGSWQYEEQELMRRTQGIQDFLCKYKPNAQAR